MAKSTAELIKEFGEETSFKILKAYGQKLASRKAKKAKSEQDLADFKAWVAAGRPKGK